MQLNSVSKSCPHWANRVLNSFKTPSVSLRVTSISCATNRESLRATACAGVTSSFLTRRVNNSLLFFAGSADGEGTTAGDTDDAAGAAVVAGIVDIEATVAGVSDGVDVCAD